VKKINKTRYAILGMLFEKARSGYEIRQRMLGSTIHFWQESDASIYPMLRMLEDEGKVTSRDEFVGKRAKKIFEITKTGKKEFISWMALPAEADKHRDELLLKLFFGASTTKEKMIKQLLLKLERCEKTKNQLTNIETDTLATVTDTHPHKLFWQMTLRNGIIHCDAEIKWIKDCIEKLKD
jgi:PadR family transcriptional regulator, regulatory protein AphA